MADHDLDAANGCVPLATVGDIRHTASKLNGYPALKWVPLGGKPQTNGLPPSPPMLFREWLRRSMGCGSFFIPESHLLLLPSFRPLKIFRSETRSQFFARMYSHRRKRPFHFAL